MVKGPYKVRRHQFTHIEQYRRILPEAKLADINRPPDSPLKNAMRLDTVLFSPPPEGGLVDAENRGRFLKRSGAGQDSPDMRFFDLVQTDRVTDLDLGASR